MHYPKQIVNYLRELHTNGKYRYYDEMDDIVVERYDGFTRCPMHLISACSGACSLSHHPIINKRILSLCLLTKRPVPQLPTDIWLIIIGMLESDKKASWTLPGISIFGRSAHSAVQRYVQQLFKLRPYPFIQHSVRVGAVKVTSTRRVSIIGGSYVRGVTALVVVKHPNLEKPLRMVSTVDTTICRVPVHDLYIAIDADAQPILLKRPIGYWNKFTISLK